jgi:hypothetical protein
VFIVVTLPKLANGVIVRVRGVTDSIFLRVNENSSSFDCQASTLLFLLPYFSKNPFAHFISYGIIRRISLQKLLSIWPSVSAFSFSFSLGRYGAWRDTVATCQAGRTVRSCSRLGEKKAAKVSAVFFATTSCRPPSLRPKKKKRTSQSLLGFFGAPIERDLEYDRVNRVHFI